MGLDIYVPSIADAAFQVFKIRVYNTTNTSDIDTFIASWLKRRVAC
jgi:hypothetical protein